MSTIERWNERYRRGEFPDEPSPLVTGALRDVPPGRALDLACGAGRHARWLAARGWDVVALDGAEEAIRLLREREPRVDARLLDLETDAPLPFADASFDLVVIIDFLWRPLFAEARRLLKPGGLCIASIRTECRYSLSAEALRAEFAGWELSGALLARKPQ